MTAIKYPVNQNQLYWIKDHITREYKCKTRKTKEEWMSGDKVKYNLETWFVYDFLCDMYEPEGISLILIKEDYSEFCDGVSISEVTRV